VQTPKGRRKKKRAAPGGRVAAQHGITTTGERDEGSLDARDPKVQHSPYRRPPFYQVEYRGGRGQLPSRPQHAADAASAAGSRGCQASNSMYGYFSHSTIASLVLGSGIRPAMTRADQHLSAHLSGASRLAFADGRQPFSRSEPATQLPRETVGRGRVRGRVPRPKVTVAGGGYLSFTHTRK